MHAPAEVTAGHGAAFRLGKGKAVRIVNTHGSQVVDCVAIARALAMRPNVLPCDEITSALDPELVNEVLRVVETLAREGMTLILVTHEMRFARDVGTKLMFMHMGKVHEEGPPKELMAKPKTAELQQFIGSVG